MTRPELEEILAAERKLYLGAHPNMLMLRLFPEMRYVIWRCLESFRRMQYWHEVKNSSNISWLKRTMAKLRYYHYNRKYFRYSCLCGVELASDVHIGRMCNIWHCGVVVNGDLGDNCVLHGYNTIGNKGVGRGAERPVLGNGVDVGIGAVVIGKVRIADRCMIGANAAVVKSVDEPDSIVVGVPGKVLKRS